MKDKFREYYNLRIEAEEIPDFKSIESILPVTGKMKRGKWEPVFNIACHALLVIMIISTTLYSMEHRSPFQESCIDIYKKYDLREKGNKGFIELDRFLRKIKL